MRQQEWLCSSKHSRELQQGGIGDCDAGGSYGKLSHVKC